MGALSTKASDPATTPAELEALWHKNKKRWDTREEGLLAIARNPNTPLPVLQEMMHVTEVTPLLRGDNSMVRFVLSEKRIAAVAAENLQGREARDAGRATPS